MLFGWVYLLQHNYQLPLILQVQDQVVNLVQELLINRLQKHDKELPKKQLPWMLLDAITRHNMRHHLQKACGLLAQKTSCIRYVT